MTEYGTELREGELMFSADYSIRNPGPAAVEYKIRFSFSGPDFVDMRWATRTVKAGKTATGSVSMPWPSHLETSEVKVAEVLETLL
ncbi:hypothetical protein [Streptomyces sp. CRN 30]|uniref:hypothetical protein n=1 Tax=Streptomyces sp. CRN 30 TaxID=3075613 RepID=UPI002A82EAC4|nr:hypothetical protein [Streptomyces sp. CRN 30]